MINQLLTAALILVMIFSTSTAQTRSSQSTQAELESQDVIRISTSLVQTDVVVEEGGKRFEPSDIHPNF
jgi:ABC-type iron transport system FetAB permease component